MATSISVPTSVVNTGSLGGDQIRGHTAALANGGFAVFWTDPITLLPTIFVQRYDGLGNAVGGPVDTGLAGTLNDLCVTASGNIALAVAAPNGTTAVVAVLDGTSFAQVGSSSQGAGGTIGSMQIDPVSGDIVRLMMTDTAGTVRLGTANATGGNLSLSTITSVAAGTNVLELAQTNTTTADFGLLSNGTVLALSGTSLATGLTGVLDFMRLQPGFYVVARSQNGVMAPVLQAVAGVADVTNAAQLAVGGHTVGGFITGSGTLTNAQVTSCELLDLGNGRIFMAWGAFRGDGTFNGLSGVYAGVFNTANSQIEGAAVLLRSVGALTTLQDTTINAAVMADGRVAVTISTPNGLAGDDVFRAVVDPRIEGITVTGTSAADAYVGTALDDKFFNIHVNDTVIGGTGNDTIVIAGSGARNIDLASPNTFPGGAVLDSIENVVTSVGNDIVYGTSVANILNGAAGNDNLVGRSGNDSLLGGSGNDTLDGGQNDDTLDGGTNNDRILGGAGADLIFGSAGNDTAYGGEGDDLLQGGDNDDALSGGTGADTLYGGAGDDSLTTGTGEDVVFAGDGNDAIFVTDNANVINGEGGIDRVIYSGALIGPNLAGVYADLADVFEPLAAILGYDPDGNTYTDVENLTGSRGNDFLAGDAGGNRLHGGTGNDFLLGRSGTDTLIGGAGDDTFIFDAVVAANDRVRDFTTGTDKIGILLDVFGDIDSGNIAARFVASAGATPAANASAQFLFDNAGAGAGRLFFDADGNGAGAAVLIATITFATADGLTSFGSGDFVFLG